MVRNIEQKLTRTANTARTPCTDEPLDAVAVGHTRSQRSLQTLLSCMRFLYPVPCLITRFHMV
jgi:hypothetical protein